MIIIGVDFHPSFQQISFMDQETGECGDRRLNHSDGEAERFYKELKERGVSVRVGLEATGYSRWFERLLAELGFEVWIGDAAEIKRQRGRKQKTDREDARLLLKLLLENRFPRIWVPSPENRDLRQLLWHRHRLVQMLSGFLKCGICGGNLVIVTGRGPGRYPKYDCSQNFYRGACPHNLKERQDWVEDRLLSELQDAVLTPEAIEYTFAEFGRQLKSALSSVSNSRGACNVAGCIGSQCEKSHCS